MKDQEAKSWLLLLKSLLKLSDEDIQSFELKIELSENIIYLETNNSDLAQRLTKTLQSPTTLYHNLQYKITSASSPAPKIDANELYPALPLLGDLLKPDILEHLIHPELIKKIGVQWGTGVQQEQGYLLYFPLE